MTVNAKNISVLNFSKWSKRPSNYDRIDNYAKVLKMEQNSFLCWTKSLLNSDKWHIFLPGLVAKEKKKRKEKTHSMENGLQQCF